VYPGFLEHIQGKEILDHGSGLGFQSAALAMRGAKHVVGLDVRADHMQIAQDLILRLGLEDRVEFRECLGPELEGRFDLVISQNSMEHYPDPAGCLAEMVRALKPSGKILLTFGPPWHAPHGSHMHFFTRVPWVNLLFREKTVINVRRHFRDDGARRYEEVEGGLNRMTLRKFDRLLAGAGLRVLYRRNEGVKGLHFLTKIPVLRELFTNNIACELARE
jgi:SAM-dependent methyltransferase